MNNNSTKVGKMFNYFNEDDSALWWWEKNNWWKPHGTSGYGYTDEAGGIDTYEPENGDRFYKGSTTLTFELDAYEIFTSCAESRSKPLGNCKNAVPANDGFDLKADPDLKYGKDDYCHSRQFKSNIEDEWQYWNKVMSHFELTQSN